MRLPRFRARFMPTRVRSRDPNPLLLRQRRQKRQDRVFEDTQAVQVGLGKRSEPDAPGLEELQVSERCADPLAAEPDPGIR